MANKNDKKTSTTAYVAWMLIAIIGAGLLFSGLTTSVQGTNIVMSVMFMVIGIILTFIGLVMIFGNANLENKSVKKVEKEDKPEEVKK